MKRRKIISGVGALLSVILIVTGCNSTSDNEANTSSNTPETVQTSEETSSSNNTSTISTSEVTGQYDDEDLDASWDESSAANITLDGSFITVDGSGATADGSNLTISAAGTYVLNGTLADGQVVITASDSETVRLILNGVDITSDESYDIYSGSSILATVTAGTGGNTGGMGGNQGGPGGKQGGGRR